MDSKFKSGDVIVYGKSDNSVRYLVIAVDDIGKRLNTLSSVGL